MKGQSTEWRRRAEIPRPPHRSNLSWITLAALILLFVAAATIGVFN